MNGYMTFKIGGNIVEGNKNDRSNLSEKSVLVEADVLIGQGATGKVFLHVEENTQKEYVIKKSKNKGLLFQESNILQMIQHPIFPKWISYYEEKNIGCLCMEYIKGENLNQYIKRRGGLGEKEAIGILLDLLEGICYLHNHNPILVFQDLKPENILRSEDGTIRIVDVGTIIKIEEKVSVAESNLESEVDCVRAGTYGYSAPEQFLEGKPITRSSDIFALGSIGYFLLTGNNFFDIKTENFAKYKKYFGLFRIKKQIMKKDLLKIITKCMNEFPENRYPNGENLKYEILWLMKRRTSLLLRFRNFCAGNHTSKVIYVKSVLKK